MAYRMKDFSPRSRPGYEGHYGNVANPVIRKTAEKLKVSCPACGASKGSDCRNRRGEAITGVHKVRADRALKESQ